MLQAPAVLEHEVVEASIGGNPAAQLRRYPAMVMAETQVRPRRRSALAPAPCRVRRGIRSAGGVPAGGADRSAARSFLARGSKTRAVAVEGGEGWT